VKLERLALGQAGEAGLLDRRDVHEHVLAAVIAHDEAEALLPVEEFDDALGLADHLGGHAATGRRHGHQSRRRRRNRRQSRRHRRAAAEAATAPPKPPRSPP
jgi:hypothetical protein